jgi:hypothetical protein
MARQLAVLSITLLSAGSAFALEAGDGKAGGALETYPENSKQSALAPALGIPSDAVHGANFGVGLRRHCAELGVEFQVSNMKDASPLEYLIATLKVPVARDSAGSPAGEKHEISQP